MRDQLLRKEKDEASLCRVCETGFPERLHSPILRGVKVFYFGAAESNCAARPIALVRRCPPLRLQTSLWSLNQNCLLKQFSGQN
jgi:hypothetical protein